MAITDNLVSHVYAESGDTSVTDKVQSLALSGTATAALTTVGGEDAWNLTGGNLSVSVPSFSYVASGTTAGGGYSFAFRYRINTFGSTGGYNEIAAAGEQRFTKNGAGVRSKYSTQQYAAITGAEATATVHTVVLVVKPNRDSNSFDYTEVWKNQASRGNNDPDFTSNAVNNSDTSVTSITLTAPDTMDIDVLDFAYWERELTDAEAASVADDIRAQLPVGGGGDTTPDAFSFTDQTDVALSTQITSNTITVTGIDTATAISVTGGEMSINAGAFTSTSTTVNNNDTVQLRQTSSASNSTQTDVTLDIGGVTDIWSVTTLAPIVTGTLTSKPLVNLSNAPQSPTGVKLAAVNLADLTVLATNLSVDADGSHQLSLTDAGITPGTSYALLQISSDNTICNVDIRVAT